MDEVTLRKMAIEKYLRGEAPVSIYSKLGRTKPWFFKWLHRYQTKDAEWYKSKHKTSHNHPHKISLETQKLIKEIRIQLEKHPGAQIGASAIKKELKKLGVTPPSDRTIHRILKGEGLLKKTSYPPEERATTTIKDSQNIQASFSDWRVYKSLGSLIKDYRHWRQLSQEIFAGSIGISVRELQRWETDRRRARIENLHDLSEFTGIPMQVCVALNADQPVWYALQERRFGYSAMEVAQFESDEILKHPKHSDDTILIRTDRITTDKHMRMIESCHRDIYDTRKPLGKDVIQAACMIVPELNRIAFDCWGHYVGHQVCLPLKFDLYQKLKRQRGLESYLTIERLSDIIALHEGVFCFYSVFAAGVNLAQSSAMNSLGYLAGIEPKERYLIAIYAATAELKQVCNDWGMKIRFRSTGKYEHTHAEIVPTMYEIKLDVFFMRNLGLFDTLKSPNR